MLTFLSKSQQERPDVHRGGSDAPLKEVTEGTLHSAPGSGV